MSRVHGADRKRDEGSDDRMRGVFLVGDGQDGNDEHDETPEYTDQTRERYPLNEQCVR